MGLLKCKKCGEMYADSYKSCPFCAEDEEYYNGRVSKRNRRPNEKKVKRPSAIGPVLILAVLVIMGGLVWAIFGNHSGGLFGTKDPGDQQTGIQIADNQNQQTPVETLVLNKTALLLAIDSSEKLTAEGQEDVDWESSNPTVAVVTTDGTVKGLSEGTAIITARCGDLSATCSVSVAEESDTPVDPVTDPANSGTPGNTGTVAPTKPSGGTTPTKPTTGAVDLSKMVIKIPDYGITLQKNAEGNYDISMAKNESFRMEVSGISGTVTWTTSNSSAVTVDSDGTIKRLAAGEATITGKVGSSSFTILVRTR